MIKSISTKLVIASIAATVVATSAFATTTITTVNNTAQASTAAFGLGSALSCSTGTKYDSWSSTSTKSPNGVTNAADTTTAVLGADSGIAACGIVGCNVAFYSDDHCGTKIDSGKISYKDGVITVTAAPTSGHVAISGSGTDSLTMTITP